MRKEALTQRNVKFYTKQKVSVGTNFYLKLMYTSQYTGNCRISFNVIERDIMYHLDFRVSFDSLHYNVLVQGMQENGAWQGHLESREAMNLVEGDNDVSVTVGQDYFRVWINRVKYEENVEVDPARLSRYSNLDIKKTGTCVSFDNEESYAIFSSGKYKTIEYSIFCQSI